MIPCNAFLDAALSYIIIKDFLTYTRCCQTPRLWALIYVPAGLWFVEYLNEYKAGNMVR
jgi:hypothetical protein